MTTHWIWQQPDWPDFNWQAERLTPLLRACVQAQGQLMGMAGSVDSSLGGPERTGCPAAKYRDLLSH